METGGESMPTMDSAGGGSRFSQFFTSEVRATSGEQQPQGQQQQPLQPQPQKDLEHSRSSITDEVLGNVINNNNKNQRDDSPNAFMHQVSRIQIRAPKTAEKLFCKAKWGNLSSHNSLFNLELYLKVQQRIF